MCINMSLGWQVAQTDYESCLPGFNSRHLNQLDAKAPKYLGAF